jgi:hypothetical protein
MLGYYSKVLAAALSHNTETLSQSQNEITILLRPIKAATRFSPARLLLLFVTASVNREMNYDVYHFLPPTNTSCPFLVTFVYSLMSLNPERIPLYVGNLRGAFPLSFV